jgi:hypothetical protein
MTLEEWRRAKEVFDAVWELEPHARESYLAAACPGEESVRAEVERMLFALAQNEAFLEEPLLFDAAMLPAGEQAERLKLFRSVCAAVAHAHQHLVIHRRILL